MKVLTDNDFICYDEIGWGTTTFSPIATAKKILEEYLESISAIEFLIKERVIVIRVIKDINDNPLSSDYYFRDVDCDFLNYLCKFNILHTAIKNFFIKCNYNTSKIDKYPLLMTIILGNST